MSTERENSSLNDKIVYDFSKFTHLDYPGHLACIVWFSGCNMRCDFCYNADIVYAKNGNYSMNDILDFLKSRVGLLDGVVLSGGEATSHSLKKFCQQIKKLGFLIKLDTNGTDYEQIKELLALDLLDFIALDYKAPEYKFKQITHSKKFSLFSKSLDLLMQSKITYEVRTTLHNDLLNVQDINCIIEDLSQRGYSKTYYIQKFVQTSNIANLSQSSQKFQEEALSTKIPIEWR